MEAAATAVVREGVAKAEETEVEVTAAEMGEVGSAEVARGWRRGG